VIRWLGYHQIMSVELHPQFIVDEKGERRSVVLSIEEFEAMLDEIEDYEDALLLHQMAAEAKPEDFTGWEEVKAELQAKGKI
jgi:PHD/YefM family antitoxin component YafN of YafNO toxin-antitoxin module